MKGIYGMDNDKKFMDLEGMDNDFFTEIQDIIGPALNSENIKSGIWDIANGKVNRGTGKKHLAIYPIDLKYGIWPVCNNILAICTAQDKLTDVLASIKSWCNEFGMIYKNGISKHVVLIVDEWNQTEFQSYQDEFRRLAMHEDFWFMFYSVSESKLTEIPFLPHHLYKFTRHFKTDDYSLSSSSIFEGLAHVDVSEAKADVATADDESPYLYFRDLEDEGEKYRVAIGRYRDENKPQFAVSIGIWNENLMLFSAFAKMPKPISTRNSKVAGQILNDLRKVKNREQLFKEYNRLAAMYDEK